MEFKDYYATLGVDRTSTQDEVKRAYRKLARKFHPDVSKEADAEAHFKDVAEAYEVLGDVEKRAAYDDLAKRPRRGPDFEPPPGWDNGFEFRGGNADNGAAPDFSAFFETLFGRRARGGMPEEPSPMDTGSDHHAKISIDLEDAYRGARRTISLRMPVLDAQGVPSLQERQLDVNIPQGVRQHQQLRLAGQGGAGVRGSGRGDLYLEILFNPHPRFRVDGRDVYLDLPLAPWEAALGATVTVPMPEGSVELSIPPNSAPGRRLRLNGKGLPSKPPGDLYVVLAVRLPQADSTPAKEAWSALARSFPDFNPRSDREA